LSWIRHPYRVAVPVGDGEGPVEDADLLGVELSTVEHQRHVLEDKLAPVGHREVAVQHDGLVGVGEVVAGTHRPLAGELGKAGASLIGILVVWMVGCRQGGDRHEGRYREQGSQEQPGALRIT
jgi:hypothetical protein